MEASVASRPEETGGWAGVYGACDADAQRRAGVGDPHLYPADDGHRAAPRRVRARHLVVFGREDDPGAEGVDKRPGGGGGSAARARDNEDVEAVESARPEFVDR